MVDTVNGKKKKAKRAIALLAYYDSENENILEIGFRGLLTSKITVFRCLILSIAYLKF